jgi:hypothetical protein
MPPKAPAKKPAAKVAAAPAKVAAAPAKVKPQKTETKSETGKAGVHVRGLKFDGMNRESVKELFAHCGPISQLRTKKNARGGGYVLVFFEQASSAKKCVDSMNGKVVKGNRIQVSIAANAKPVPDRAEYCQTVFVAPISRAVTKDQLREEFKTAGQTIKVRVYRAGYGFVYFKSVADCTNAMRNLDGKEIAGKKVTLRRSVRTKEGDLKKASRFGKAKVPKAGPKVKVAKAPAADAKAAAPATEAKAAAPAPAAKAPKVAAKVAPKVEKAAPAKTEKAAPAPAKAKATPKAAPAAKAAKKQPKA